MKRTTILVAALAVLVVATGAAAAAPGSTAQSDTGSADAAGGMPAQAQADGAGQVGPPDQLPGPVPDFVSDVHGLIQQFIDGTLDVLGPNVSDAAGNGDAAGDGSAPSTATAT